MLKLLAILVCLFTPPVGWVLLLAWILFDK